MGHIAWAVHEGDGVYRYGGSTAETLGHLKLVDGRPERIDGPLDWAQDWWLTVALALRGFWSQHARLPERFEVPDPAEQFPETPLPPRQPPEPVVRSGRLRRADSKPVSLRELAERRQRAPGGRPPTGGG